MTTKKTEYMMYVSLGLKRPWTCLLQFECVPGPPLNFKHILSCFYCVKNTGTHYKGSPDNAILSRHWKLWYYEVIQYLEFHIPQRQLAAKESQTAGYGNQNDTTNSFAGAFRYSIQFHTMYYIYPKFKNILMTEHQLTNPRYRTRKCLFSLRALVLTSIQTFLSFPTAHHRTTDLF